jgi:mRNA interferase ChpB
MERGAIYRVNLATPAGALERSVLVVSPTPFNRVTGLPVVVPITPGPASARTAGFAVSLLDAGTRTTGIVHCNQPHTLDIAARGGQFVERAPAAVVEEVLARLGPIFS